MAQVNGNVLLLQRANLSVERDAPPIGVAPLTFTLEDIYI